MKPLASEPAIDTPYLSAAEAAIYLKYASVRSLYKAVKNAGIPVRHCGTKLLFHRGELDRWLAGESKVALLKEARSRHAATVTPIRVERSSNTVGGDVC